MSSTTTTTTQPLTLFTEDQTFVSISGLTASHSTLLNDMLADMPEATTTTKPIPIYEMSGSTLKKLVSWMENNPPPSTSAPSAAEAVTHVSRAGDVLTPFDEAFFAVSEQEMCEIITAANYMNIQELLSKALLVIARLTVGKNAWEIRTVLGLEDDFDEEEKKAVKMEMGWYLASVEGKK